MNYLVREYRSISVVLALSWYSGAFKGSMRHVAGWP